MSVGEVEVLKVENSRVRAEQLAKLYELRSSRDRVRVDAALAELSRAAAARGCAGTSGLGSNLMAPGPPIPPGTGSLTPQSTCYEGWPSGWGTHWIGERSVEPNPLPPPFCVG